MGAGFLFRKGSGLQTLLKLPRKDTSTSEFPPATTARADKAQLQMMGISRVDSREDDGVEQHCNACFTLEPIFPPILWSQNHQDLGAKVSGAGPALCLGCPPKQPPPHAGVLPVFLRSHQSLGSVSRCAPLGWLISL